ncbi:MAG: hypothetical protein ABEL97_05945 [Salinibacter sp.]
MSSVDRRELDAPPDESTIATLREEAAAQDVSIETHYPAGDDQKRLVVSPRGTVVVLNDVSETTFNRSTSPAEIAAELRE